MADGCCTKAIFAFYQLEWVFLAVFEFGTCGAGAAVALRLEDPWALLSHFHHSQADMNPCDKMGHDQSSCPGRLKEVHAGVIHRAQSSSYCRSSIQHLNPRNTEGLQHQHTSFLQHNERPTGHNQLCNCLQRSLLLQ